MTAWKYFLSNFWTEIDKEGCLEPDNDEPQQMGDASIEVILLFWTLNYFVPMKYWIIDRLPSQAIFSQYFSLV